MPDLIEFPREGDDELEPLSEDIQVGVGMELMCLTHHDDPASWAHANTIMHFAGKDSPYKIKGKDIIPHVKRQLIAKREFLRAEVAAGRSPVLELQVEDSLDDWTIRYELRDDGSVSKIYIDTNAPSDESFTVILDPNDEMQFPSLPEGGDFVLQCGDDAVVEYLVAGVEKLLREQGLE